MAAILPTICSTLRHSNGKNGYPDIDWDTIGYGIIPTDYMYMMKCSKNEEFAEGKLVPYGNIELSPAAGVLNYGQGLFEGMKAMRTEDGRVVLFRPNENALRMKTGAERMCMPSPSVSQFIDAVKQTAVANKRWIPPYGKGSMYIRPLLIGTGPILGMSPAPEYTFLIYTSPVRNYYFKEGSGPLNLFVEDHYKRATYGGVGGVKSITNYAPSLKPSARAKDRGFSEVLYLDSLSGKYVEEATSSNVFIVKDKRISTPPTEGTILPGITRKSIIEIARDHGFMVEERQIAVEELFEVDEVFCTGTAVVVAPVGSITYQGKRVEYQTDTDTVTKMLLSTYVGIQSGKVEDKKGWLVEIN